MRELLGGAPTKAAVYDLEQAIQQDLTERRARDVVTGEIGLDQLLRDDFVRGLHLELYGDIWSWAGAQRIREINIGVAPEQISMQMRESLDTISYRWANTTDWTARELGIALHAELVRIHPFVDGNGRSTRLLADLVFLAAQDDEEPATYDWDLEKPRYIELLREYDTHRDPAALAAFVGVTEFN